MLPAAYQTSFKLVMIKQYCNATMNNIQNTAEENMHTVTRQFNKIKRIPIDQEIGSFAKQSAFKIQLAFIQPRSKPENKQAIAEMNMLENFYRRLLPTTRQDWLNKI
jgi:hypothetical protein